MLAIRKWLNLEFIWWHTSCHQYVQKSECMSEMYIIIACTMLDQYTSSNILEASHVANCCAIPYCLACLWISKEALRINSIVKSVVHSRCSSDSKTDDIRIMLHDLQTQVPT